MYFLFILLASFVSQAETTSTALGNISTSSTSICTKDDCVNLDDLLNRIKVSGQFRMRAERDDHTDYNGIRSPIYLRIRPNVTVKAASDLDVVIEPQFTKTSGETVYTPSGAAANSVQTTSGTTYDESFNVHQGYANYHPLEWMSVMLGRQTMSYGNDLIIGANDWNNIGRAFDGARLRTKYDLGFTKGFSDLWATKLVHNDEGTKTGSGGGDANFFGLYNGYDFGRYFHQVEPYLLYRDDDTGVSDVVLYNAGLRVASTIGAVDYRVEGDAQWGTVSSSAYQYDAEAGYTFDGKIRPRVALEYFEAGANYDQLYPSAHGWIGVADIFTRRNIRGLAFKAKAEPLANFTAQFEFHYLMRTSSDAPAYKFAATDSGPALGSETVSSSMFLGTEYDLTVSYLLTKRTTVLAGVSLFQEGSYISDQNLTVQGPPVFGMLQIQAYF